MNYVHKDILYITGYYFNVLCTQGYRFTVIHIRIFLYNYVHKNIDLLYYIYSTVCTIRHTGLLLCRMTSKEDIAVQYILHNARAMLSPVLRHTKG